MMKGRQMTGKHALAVMALALLVFIGMSGSLPTQVFADVADSTDSAPFTYHITVSGGLHGTVDGKDQVDVKIQPGEEWNPNDYTVTLRSGDDKYYFKGFHVSGIEGVLTGAKTIHEDMVFVATYGIKGDLVAYTVSYVDEEGAKLLPSGTFYGNPGDKPVVAYQYIEGYLPQAYNLTATLKADGPNEFTFVYTKDARTEEGGAGGNDAAGSGSTDAAESAQGATPGTVAGTTGAGTGTAEGENGPADLLDLDELEVPLADGSGNDGSEQTIADEEGAKAEGGLSSGGWITAIAGAAAGAGLLAWLIAFFKRRRASGGAE